MAKGKKNFIRLGAHLIFVDESGFMLTPHVRKTWAPVGHTPIIRHRFRNDRISVIAGITVSCARYRLGLIGAFSVHNIRQVQVEQFLLQTLRHFRGHLIVILDNSPIHRGTLINELCERFSRLHLEYFPAYAPEINPQEGVWAITKGRLANSKPDDIDDLENEVTAQLRSIARSHRILRGCIQHSELPLFLL